MRSSRIIRCTLLAACMATFLLSNFVVIQQVAAEEVDEASDGNACQQLDSDLDCSACSIFIDEFFNSVARAPSALFKEGTSTKNLWHDGVQKLTAANVYEQRIRKIYKAEAPKKLRRVHGLMKKYKGDEYNLYVRVCGKYNVTPEPEYEAPEDDEDDEEERNAWKYKVAEEALEIVKELPKKGQWAVSGVEGNRKFADFNKLMSSGGTMENLSMGGHVSDNLSGCINYLADTFKDDLGNVIFNSQKPFSSGLHKKFCKQHGHCKKKGRKQRGEL